MQPSGKRHRSGDEQRKMKILVKLAVCCGLLVAVLQLVRPSIPSSPAVAEVQAPPKVRQILAKDCYSCHSSERRLAWFDQIVPAYWLVRQDVLTAREHLNFSTLGTKPSAAQKATLYEAVNMIQLGAMPLPRFVALHPDAKVSPEELAVLKSYLAPWSGANVMLASASSSTEMPFHLDLARVQPEFGGFSLPTGFEDWTPISFTDRGDNNTLRIILGNEIAVRAARTGSISPWPDGASFAKIAWEQVRGEDGLIHPGRFVQVEFMVKDARRYPQTDGWGWGRWRGAALKPYGSNPDFVGECTRCHKPMRGNDFVYTLPITSATIRGDEVVNNKAAALPATLPWQPLGWKAITLYVDPAEHTMAALYGNEQAVRAARAGRESKSPGEVLALVTWNQRDDPHWFGARIPDLPQSVEFVEADASGKLLGYRRYDGPELGERSVPAALLGKRIKFITSLAPAWMP